MTFLFGRQHSYNIRSYPSDALKDTNDEELGAYPVERVYSRPIFEKLGGWVLTLAKQSGRVVRTMSRRASAPHVMLPSDQFGEYVPSPGSHLFYAAYLCGDLQLLDACIKELQLKYGQRAFIALAKANPKQITLSDWIQSFSLLERRTKSSSNVLVEKCEEERRTAFERAFDLLYILTSKPRTELLDRQDTNSKARKSFVFQTDSSIQKALRSKRVAPNGSEECNLEMVLVFADFEMAQVQLRRAFLLSERLAKGTPAYLTAIDRSREIPYLEVALDGVSPTVRLMRAARRNAKAGSFLESSSDLTLLLDLLSLEPTLTTEAFLSTQPPVAIMLGYVIRYAAKSLLNNRKNATCQDSVMTLVLSFKVSRELSRIHKFSVNRQKEPLTPKAPTLLHHRASFTQNLRSKMKIVPFEFNSAADDSAFDLKSQSLGYVLDVIERRSVVFALLTLEVLPASDPALASILAATWNFLDECHEPDIEVMRPLLLKLAEIAGFDLKRNAYFAEVSHSSPYNGGMNIFHWKGEAPMNLPQILEATTTLLQTKTKVAVLKQRKDTLVLYGATLLVGCIVKEHLRAFNETSAFFDAQRFCDLLKPHLLEIVALRSCFHTNAAASRTVKRKHGQICGDVTKEAEVRELRRSLFGETELRWKELSTECESNGSEESDDEDEEDFVKVMTYGSDFALEEM